MKKFIATLDGVAVLAALAIGGPVALSVCAPVAGASAPVPTFTNCSLISKVFMGNETSPQIWPKLITLTCNGFPPYC